MGGWIQIYLEDFGASVYYCDKPSWAKAQEQGASILENLKLPELEVKRQKVYIYMVSHV